MRSGPMLRALGPLAVAASVAACGFEPHPRSATFACNPQGAACCPEGYVCVGRASGSNAVYSLGTCWYKEDLPSEALVLSHDQTPAIPNDPACLVTDWLPPSGGGYDADVADAPMSIDEGTEYDAGVVDVPMPIDEGTGYDAGVVDAPMRTDASAVDVAGSEASAPLDLGTREAGTAVDGPTGPVTVTGLSVGGGHACALVSGGVRCWGANGEGQLGDGTTSSRLSPVPVVGLQAGVTAVSAGNGHTCAVVNGGARCWGSNGGCGKLGDYNPIHNQLAPVSVVGLDSGVTDIAAGSAHTCAVVNGGVQCWGSNLGSELGDESTKGLCVRTPIPVAGLTSGVTAIAIGSGHTCALVNGGVLCWGGNRWGQLGDNSSTERTVPVQVVGLQAGVTAIAAGLDTTCAVVDGGARCWGENRQGQLGDGSTTDKLAPVPVQMLAAKVTAIAVGAGRACAIVGGAARCWGNDPYGSDFNESDLVLQPMAIWWLEAGVRSISAGSFSCALAGNGVKCWGLGSLGDGLASHRGTPVDVLFH